MERDDLPNISEKTSSSLKLDTVRQLKIRKYFTGIFSFAIVFCIIAINYNNIKTVNVIYQDLDSTYKVGYAFAVKLSARIEMAEGYDAGLPILMVGEISEEDCPTIEGVYVQSLLDFI